MKFLVLGGGRQGSAAAFDLSRRDEVEKVVVGDRSLSSLPSFLDPYLGSKIVPLVLDATQEEQVLGAMTGMDGVLNALPYWFNLEMTRLAIRSGAHICDLGGNTGIVKEQRRLDAEAVEAGVSVIPDQGLAPGLVNILAQAGIDALDTTESVRIRVGGLPRDPRPPLNYQVVFSLEGVLDYYTTDSVVLQDGELVEVEALSGLETVSFPEPVGELEAFHTGGGISTLPFRYEGEIDEMSYKTLRYPGHAEIMKAIRDLGLLDESPVEVDGARISPRRFFIDLVSPQLRNPEAPDLVAARVEVRGRADGGERTVRYDLVDHFDEVRGMSAMMRTTGFSLSVTALMQADGRIDDLGVRTPDEAVPADIYLRELGTRGVRVERTDF